ncbi:MAG: helix-turn-helix domain-containing protein [Hyphomonadaceae bacterium]|nr:helix-turn-helix domain-containing protein [Hyphomonadaceae bacterium]
MKRRGRDKRKQVGADAQPDLFASAGALQSATVKAPTIAANDQKPKAPPAPKQVVFVRPPNGLLRVREAAARLGLAKSTLDRMRCEGRGPRFVKITGKIVGYDPTDLDAYAEGRKRQSTSEC